MTKLGHLNPRNPYYSCYSSDGLPAPQFGNVSGTGILLVIAGDNNTFAGNLTGAGVIA